MSVLNSKVVRRRPVNLVVRPFDSMRGIEDENGSYTLDNETRTYVDVAGYLFVCRS